MNPAQPPGTSRARIVRNAGAAIAQVVASGVLLFLLYRFLLGAVGVERLGIWSVVLASATAARVSELGLTAGVVKFVARHRARGHDEGASLAVQTALLTLSVFVGALLVLAWWPIAWVLPRLLPGEALAEALALLPLALLAMWCTTLGGIVLAALDGCERTDLRARFAVLGNFLLLLTAFWLVPGHGLVGLAVGQVGVAALLAVLAWHSLRGQLPSLPALPRRWHGPDFRELLRYGVTLQVGTIAQLLYDPVTKGLLAKFGGLAAAGYYEMASRMVMQLRGLMVAPNQVAVPVVASLHESNPARVSDVYQLTYRIYCYVGPPFYAAIVAVVPAVSLLWIGELEPTFAGMAVLLTVGWFLNGLTNPAYFVNLGTGRLLWNTLSHVAIGVLNVVLGYVLGMALGGNGVVLAWILALVLGSSIVMLAYHREQGLAARTLQLGEGGVLLAWCLVGIAGAWLVQWLLLARVPALLLLVAAAAAFAAVVLLPAWMHPMRRRVSGLLSGAGA
jgi:O-antigen/teichoic acid export membrane protein